MAVKVVKTFEETLKKAEAIARLVGDTCYYVVQFESAGYALISADNRVQPLISYSTTERFQLEESPVWYPILNLLPILSR